MFPALAKPILCYGHVAFCGLLSAKKNKKGEKQFN